MSEDYDQRFKTMLEAFFADFLQIVVPNHAPRMQADKAEFLRQDQFTDILQGERRGVDLVAKVPSAQNTELVLIHIEVEGVFRSEFANRMRRYAMQLALRYDLPLLPIVLFLKGGPPDVSKVERKMFFFDEEMEVFRYYSFGLTGAEAEKYLARPEPLACALAALMKYKSGSEAQQKLACLQRLSRATLDPARQFLLLDCVETYLSLEGDVLDEYNALLEAEPKKEATAMELWWSQKIEEKARARGLAEGEAKGEAKGKIAGLALAVLSVLESRGLTVSDEQKATLFACQDENQLQAWIKLSLTIDSTDKLFSTPQGA